MHDPGKNPRRRDIRAPGDRVPRGALAKPAVDERPRRVARRGADGEQIDHPAKTVPFGKPARPAARREPYRERIAQHLAGKLDLAREDRAAALGVARPAFVELQPQIGRHRTDQRVAVKWAGGERTPSVAAPTGEDVGHLSAGRRAAGRRTQAAGRSRSQVSGPAVRFMPLRNKETGRRQAAPGAAASDAGGATNQAATPGRCHAGLARGDVGRGRKGDENWTSWTN